MYVQSHQMTAALSLFRLFVSNCQSVLVSLPMWRHMLFFFFSIVTQNGVSQRESALTLVQKLPDEECLHWLPQSWQLWSWYMWSMWCSVICSALPNMLTEINMKSDLCFCVGCTRRLRCKIQRWPLRAFQPVCRHVRVALQLGPKARKSAWSFPFSSFFFL